MKLIQAFWKDEQGASMAEYALLMALIAVATIGAITALRDQIITIFNSATSTMATASS
jgi:pilus assembly protein Flp/PilA